MLCDIADGFNITDLAILRFNYLVNSPEYDAPFLPVTTMM